MQIKDLIPTQEDFRSFSKILRMTKFVEKGNAFVPDVLKGFGDDRPILIMNVRDEQLQDQKLYVHDGHHRILSILLGGRTSLKPLEYKYNSVRMSDYEHASFENGWFTPFNPRLFLRSKNFMEWKMLIKHTYDLHGPEEALKVVNKNKEHYTKPRSVHSFEEFL